MKKLICVILLSTYLIVSCVGNNNSIHSTGTILSITESLDLTVSQTPRKQYLQSSTVLPAITSTESIFIPTFTPIIINSPSPTFFPSVVPDQREQIIARLLQDNGPCPGENICFWGFTPLISDADQMFDYFLSLGNRTNGFDFDFKSDMHIKFIYSTVNGYLDKLSASFEGLDSPNISNNDWMAYSLPTMLRNYGVPDEIKVLYSLGPESHDLLDIRLIYSSKGFSIEYYSAILAQLYPTCPLKEHWTAKVELNSRFDENGLQGYKDITEGIGLTIDDFSQLMKGQPGEACFKINIDKFLP
jgi:hypothetical protein